MLAVSHPFTAQADGEVYGSALLTDYGSMASIGMLLVEEPFRRMGTGTALTKAALRKAEQNKTEHIVVVSSHEAKDLYVKAGFRRVGTILVMGLPAATDSRAIKKAETKTINCPDQALRKALVAAAYEGSSSRRKVLDAFLSQKEGVFSATFAGARMTGFAGSILRLPLKGKAVRAIGPLWAEDPAQVGALVGAITQKAKTDMTCFLYQGVEGETQTVREQRYEAAECLRGLGFETRDSLPLFSYKGRELPFCAKENLFSPISLAFG